MDFLILAIISLITLINPVGIIPTYLSIIENKGTPRFTQDSKEIQTEVKESEPGSVAVMLFKNLSNDEEQEYFCEELYE